MLVTVTPEPPRCGAPAASARGHYPCDDDTSDANTTTELR